MDTVDGESAEYERAIVIRQHHRPDEPNQLQLREGEIVFVVEKDASGWWGGHKEGEKDPGWFPADSVRILPAEVSFESHLVATPPAQTKAGSTTPTNCGTNQPTFQSTQTNHRSPVRGTTHIASPQRGLDFSDEAHQQPPPQQQQQQLQKQEKQQQQQQQKQSQQPSQQQPSPTGRSLAEVERLRQENEELKRQMRHCKRQSDLDRERLERELERVRQQKEQLEDLVSEQHLTSQCSTSPEQAVAPKKSSNPLPSASASASAGTPRAAAGATPVPVPDSSTSAGARARATTPPPRSRIFETASAAAAAVTRQSQEPETSAAAGPKSEASQMDQEVSHSSRVTDVTDDEIPAVGTVRARVSQFNTMGSRTSMPQQPQTQPQQQQQKQKQQQHQQLPQQPQEQESSSRTAAGPTPSSSRSSDLKIDASAMARGSQVRSAVKAPGQLDASKASLRNGDEKEDNDGSACFGMSPIARSSPSNFGFRAK